MTTDQNIDEGTENNAGTPAETNPAQVPTEDNTPDPVSTYEGGTDLDIVSRYGDVVPDAVKNLFPSDEGDSGQGQQTVPATQGSTALPADGGQGKEITPAQTQPATTQQQQPTEGGQGEVDAMTQITSLINNLQGTNVPAQPQGTQPQEQQQGNQNPLDNIPSYDFEIPDQLINMLASEDPAERKVAMGNLIKGVSTTIHQQVVESVKGALDGVGQTVQQQIQTQQLTKQVYDEFYGEYPQYNTPQMRRVVQAVALDLMRKDAALGVQPTWSKDFMKRIGENVTNIVQRVNGNNTNTTQQAQQPAQQPATPPAQFGGNGNAAGGNSKLSKGRTSQQDFMDEI